MKIRTRSIVTMVLFGLIFVVVAVLLFVTQQQVERLNKHEAIVNKIDSIYFRDDSEVPPYF